MHFFTFQPEVKMETQEEPQFDRIDDQVENNNVSVMADSQKPSKEKAVVILSPSIYSNYTKKNLKAMESIHAKDAERATCIQFCRDTITALADRHNLQRAHIETLLSDRVSLILHVYYSKLSNYLFLAYPNKLKNFAKST